MKRLAVLAIGLAALFGGCAGSEDPHPKLERQAEQQAATQFCDEYSRAEAESYSQSADELETYAVVCE